MSRVMQMAGAVPGRLSRPVAYRGPPLRRELEQTSVLVVHSDEYAIVEHFIATTASKETVTLLDAVKKYCSGLMRSELH